MLIIIGLSSLGLLLGGTIWLVMTCTGNLRQWSLSKIKPILMAAVGFVGLAASAIVYHGESPQPQASVPPAIEQSENMAQGTQAKDLEEKQPAAGTKQLLDDSLRQQAAPVAQADAGQSICTLTGLGDTMDYFQQHKDELTAKGNFSKISPVSDGNGYISYVQFWKNGQTRLLPLSEVVQCIPDDTTLTMEQVQSYYTSLGMLGIYITGHSEKLRQRMPQYNGNFIVYESGFSDGTLVFTIKTGRAEHLKPT